MMINIRAQREKMGLSQARLSRLSNVSRYKLCLSENGGAELTTGELSRIMAALRGEATRLRGVIEEACGLMGAPREVAAARQ